MFFCGFPLNAMRRCRVFSETIKNNVKMRCKKSRYDLKKALFFSKMLLLFKFYLYLQREM